MRLEPPGRESVIVEATFAAFRFANRSGLPAGETMKKGLTVTSVITGEVRSAEKKNGVPASNDFLPLRPPKADTKEQHSNEAQKTG